MRIKYIVDLGKQEIGNPNRVNPGPLNLLLRVFTIKIEVNVILLGEEGEQPKY